MRTKFLLVSLLCFVLVQAQVMARYVYNPGSAATQSLTGEYAGVLIPTNDQLFVTGTPDFGSNALGLFTVIMPTTGIGTGSAIIFSGGQTFAGTIQAVLNPDSSSPGIIGVINTTFSVVTASIVGTGGSDTLITTVSVAQGSFNAGAVADSASVGGLGLDLSGTSILDVSPGTTGTNGAVTVTEEITFDIEGYQQSSGATAGG